MGRASDPVAHGLQVGNFMVSLVGTEELSSYFSAQIQLGSKAPGSALQSLPSPVCRLKFSFRFNCFSFYASVINRYCATQSRFFVLLYFGWRDLLLCGLVSLLSGVSEQCFFLLCGFFSLCVLFFSIMCLFTSMVLFCNVLVMFICDVLSLCALWFCGSAPLQLCLCGSAPMWFYASVVLRLCDFAPLWFFPSV